MSTRELIHPERTGLQRYASWLGPLPRNVSPTDLDFVLHRREGDRLLVLEFKPPGAELSAGQSETLEALRRHGIEAYVVRENVNPHSLNARVHDWWNKS